MKKMTQTNKEYAEALFMLALEENKAQEYTEALSLVANAVKENPDYLSFLCSPAIPIADRIEAIDQAFGKSVPLHVLSFLKILCENGHILSLSGCIEQFFKLNLVHSGKVVAQVVSAVPLSENQKAALKEKLCKLSGKEVELDCKTDTSLIGGIKVCIEGKVFDGSLKQRLHEVSQNI